MEAVTILAIAIVLAIAILVIDLAIELTFKK